MGVPMKFVQVGLLVLVMLGVWAAVRPALLAQDQLAEQPVVTAF